MKAENEVKYSKFISYAPSLLNCMLNERLMGVEFYALNMNALPTCKNRTLTTTSQKL